MTRKSAKSGSLGNFVSEWFGHRVYPAVISSPDSLRDQSEERCPFLSSATGELRKCVKADAARGVCTISSNSNGVRQDWLVCPYRALGKELVSRSVRRLFAVPNSIDPFIAPGASLAKEDTRGDVSARLEAGQPVFIYFDKKTGGELSIPATQQSPEFSFDVTIIELKMRNGSPHIDRFGILEIQTMDFHGSYRGAVRNLREALRMHPEQFASTVAENQWWLSDGVEGPNIANVFKRTFYQMMFKFQLGQHGRCAGCVLAIPKAVWDSWQRHLGRPKLEGSDEESRMSNPVHPLAAAPSAWICVFEPDASSSTTPSPILLRQMIATDAPSVSYWALNVAPASALTNIDSEGGFFSLLSRRLRVLWPQLARTAVVATEASRGKPGDAD